MSGIVLMTEMLHASQREVMNLRNQLREKDAEIERLRADVEYFKEKCYSFNAEGTIHRRPFGPQRVRGTVRGNTFDWSAENGCGFLPVSDVRDLRYITQPTGETNEP